MQTLKLTIAYDGTAYGGWQTQVNSPSIQSEIVKAFGQVLRERVKVTASGRTDAGVHAIGQVASCTIAGDLSPDVLLRALNSKLPDDIRIVRCERAAERFHALRDAIRKRYRYRIWNGPVADVFLRNAAWHVPRRLDSEPMRQALARLVGSHDFACFQSAGSPRKTTVRTLSDASLGCSEFPEATRFRADAGGLERPAQRIDIELESNGFLYNMARNIVGTLVDVGLGKRSPESMTELLASRDRRSAGMTAPPQGLTLLQVWYPSDDTEAIEGDSDPAAACDDELPSDDADSTRSL